MNNAPLQLKEMRRTLELAHGALRLSAHVLARDPDQLPSQLSGRLLGLEEPGLQPLLDSTRACRSHPWLRPLMPSLQSPGGPLLRTLLGHTFRISSVTITSDGKKAVSSDYDNLLKVWDLDQGIEECTLTGHSDWVRSVARLGTEENRVISAGDDHCLRIWDVRLRLELNALTHEGVTVVTAAADGRRVASGSSDGLIKVWNVDQGTVLCQWRSQTNLVKRMTRLFAFNLIGKLVPALLLWIQDFARRFHHPDLLGELTGSLNTVAITPDGQRVITGLADGSLNVWDVDSKKKIAMLRGHTAGINAIAVMPDGKRAVSASNDCSLKVWDLEKGLEEQTLAGHTGYILGVAVTPDGQRVVSASTDRTLWVWDLTRRTNPQILEGHAGEVGAVAVTPDGRMAVSAGWDGALKMWSLDQETAARRLPGHQGDVEQVAVTRNNRFAITASHDGTLKVWDLDQGKEKHTLSGHSAPVTSVAILPGGQRALSGSFDKTLRLWDLETGKEITRLAGHREGISSLALSGDGQCAASVDVDGELLIWELRPGSEIRIKHHLSLANRVERARRSWNELQMLNFIRPMVAITPNGDHVVASDGFYVKIWNIESGNLIRTLYPDEKHYEIRALLISGNGRQIITSDGDCLKLWNWESDTEEITLRAGKPEHVEVEAPIYERQMLAASPDEHLIVATVAPALYGHTAKVWDSEGMREILSLTGHTKQIMVVAVLADGNHVVTGGCDGDIKAWDIHSGQLVASFSGAKEIGACAVTPDGKTIIAGDRSGQVHILRLEGLPLPPPTP